jgi:hypothetical protein
MLNIKEYLPLYTQATDLPNPLDSGTLDSWNSFNSHIKFDYTHYYFIEAQSSAGLIDKAILGKMK